MAEFKVGSLDARATKFRTVPIAVTPEGFWCCPSQTVLQKTVKNQNQHTRPKVGASPPASKASSVQRAPTISSERRTHSTPTRARANSDEQRCPPADSAAPNPPKVASERPQKQHKISVGFGQIEMSDLRIVLYGKDGVAVKMSVHKNILAENSSFFADKLSRQSPVSSIEVPDCEDVEIYVETVGLMYCNDVKQRLIKQSVPRVLRILKVAELLSFRACVLSCLNYLEAVPWAGEEEENVVSSVRHLQTEDYGVTPILKRVCSDLTSPPNDTFVRIIELVLKSSDDRGRREMKSLVLKLLKESSSSASSSADLCVDTLYRYCQNCLESLLTLFQRASDNDFSEQPLELKESVLRQITLEADNLLWLTEILAGRNAAEEFAGLWSNQRELAGLHSKLPTKSRHLVSCVTARLFVAIGKGEMLPSKDTRQLLLDVWLQPLMDDYNWLQHGCRSFDRTVVEEGIGSTILTLPLEDQQAILLSWLGSFLKVGNSCPNLQKAFEVWWRRTFVRPYVEQQGSRRGHEAEVCGLRWSGSLQQLASGGNDNLVHIWDASMASSNPSLGYNRWLHRFSDHLAAVKALAWCPFQSNLLASGGGGNDRCIKFWNTHTGLCLNSVDTGAQVCALLWNKNEKELLSACGFVQKPLTLWKYPSMVKLAELEGHTSRVLCLAQSPDGSTVASVAADETLRFWNVFGTSEAPKPAAKTVHTGMFSFTHIR